MDTLGARLRYALDRKGWSVAEFQRQLSSAAEGYFEATSTLVGGVSRPMVFRYLKNTGAPPSLEWCFVAGTLLGVRPEWLAYGTGAPTEEIRRQDAPDTYLSTLIEEAAEQYYVGEWQAAQSAVHALYNTAVARCQDGTGITADQTRDVVYGLFRVLDYPAQHLGGSWDMVGNYILTATGLFKMLLESEPASTLEALIEQLWLESYEPSITIKSDVFD